MEKKLVYGVIVTAVIIVLIALVLSNLQLQKVYSLRF